MKFLTMSTKTAQKRRPDPPAVHETLRISYTVTSKKERSLLFESLRTVDCFRRIRNIFHKFAAVTFFNVALVRTLYCGGVTRLPRYDVRGLMLAWNFIRKASLIAEQDQDNEVSASARARSMSYLPGDCMMAQAF